MDGWVEWISRVNNLRYHFAICPSDHFMMAQVDMETARRLVAGAGLDHPPAKS